MCVLQARSPFLFCHPVFLTQFFLCSPQSLCSDNMSVHVCLLIPQPMQGSSSIMFLKHSWPTGIPESIGQIKKKDANAGDMQSSVSWGGNQSMSLSMSCFNTSPYPLPRLENVCTFYAEIRGKRSNLPRWLSCKESACQRRRHRFNPWVRKMPWRSNPLQYSCLGNPMDRGAWRAMVHGVTQSQTRLSD